MPPDVDQPRDQPPPDDGAAFETAKRLIDSLDALGQTAAGALPQGTGRLDPGATLLREQRAARTALDDLHAKAAASARQAARTENGAGQSFELRTRGGTSPDFISRGEAEQIEQLKNIGGKIDELKEVLENRPLQQPCWGT